MSIKLDFTPDLVGIWKEGGESVSVLERDFSIFLMYLGRKDSIKGKTIDDLGLANISEYSRTPTKISFIKQYFSSFSNTPTKPITYSGRGGKNFYHGAWKKDKDIGIFHLGDSNYVIEADNPVARSFIKFETTRLINILKEMQRQSPFLPIIPEDHIVGKL